MENGGRLNFVPSFFIDLFFRCESTVYREDGSQYNARKTINLYRNTVHRICDAQIKRSKPREC